MWLRLAFENQIPGPNLSSTLYTSTVMHGHALSNAPCFPTYFPGGLGGRGGFEVTASKLFCTLSIDHDIDHENQNFVISVLIIPVIAIFFQQSGDSVSWLSMT